jgi:hypothetical protein
MFIVAQFPLADLRIFTPTARSRLSVPDWTMDDPGRVFMRGFGRVVPRNLSGLGITGERTFADFDQAARFRGPVAYLQPGWGQSIPIEPWFRRFYFDGVCAGRFEFGFLVREGYERLVFGKGLTSPYDPRAVAGLIERIPLFIRGSELPKQEAVLAEAGDALGLAYLAATTRRADLLEFPLAETLRRGEVAVGPLSVHLRISNGQPVVESRDNRQIATPSGKGLFLTTAKGSARRGGVVVQLSETSSIDEPGAERAVRVLFSHLNALIFALGQALVFEKEHGNGAIRASVVQVLGDAIQKLKSFTSIGPKDKNDDDFSGAVRTFASAYEGRIDELVMRLQRLADQLNKPGTVGKALAYLKSLLELVITTSIKAGVEAATKVPG